MRMALGARRENVLRMVIGYGLKLVWIGMAIDLVALRVDRDAYVVEPTV